MRCPPKFLHFEYETPKIVKISNWKLGLLNKFIKIFILSYILGYVIIFNKGYQSYDTNPQSANSIKIKGIGLLTSAANGYQPESVIDMADYQFTPPVENFAFYIPTNIIITNNQTQSVCPEDSEILGVGCKYGRNPNGCITGKIIEIGNGIQTGNCIRNPDSKDPLLTGVCEIRGWCPVQKSHNTINYSPNIVNVSTTNTMFRPNYLDGQLVWGAENFTIYIKNAISFPKFGTKRRNVKDDQDIEAANILPPNSKLYYYHFLRWITFWEKGRKYDREHKSAKNQKSFQALTYLRTCRYNRSLHNWWCPVFSLNDILEFANTSYENVYLEGAIILIKINWNCNLDRHWEKCTPTYDFSRIDDQNVKFSRGWNFRQALYFRENGVMKRTLIKIYGVRCMIQTSGIAGKFSLAPTLVNLGSGIALMGLTSIPFAINKLVLTRVYIPLVLYIIKKRQLYRARKYEETETPPSVPDSPTSL